MTGDLPVWRPRILVPGIPNDADIIAQLASEPGVVVCDCMDAQLDDLLASRHPAASKAELGEARASLLADVAEARAGVWVHYPWSRALVRTLPRPLLREARLARNRNKITVAEQAALADATIGIVGLSVGRAIAHALAMEGIGRSFRLADPDVLAVSNLNRVPGALADLGLPKVVLAARALFELDPFLDIELFPHGLHSENLGAFLGSGACRLDIVLEECDDLALKIELRVRARDLRIPVIMETSERGTLDIERFDQEPARPLLHGLLEGVRPEDVRSPDAARRMVRAILPPMRPRTSASVDAVGKTLRSWPQLASEIFLGAASVTTAARALLLGARLPSGRVHVDLDEILVMKATNGLGC